MMPNGSDGCDSTGARTGESATMPSAKPPVKHIPTTPTPGPPHSSCSERASARSQSITGEVAPVASTVNSREMHAGTMLDKRVAGHRQVAPTHRVAPGYPEEVGQRHGASQVGDAPGDGDHVGGDPRDLGDDDHGRSVTGAEHVARLAVVLEPRAVEARQRVSHGGAQCPCSAEH